MRSAFRPEMSIPRTGARRPLGPQPYANKAGGACVAFRFLVHNLSPHRGEYTWGRSSRRKERFHDERHCAAGS